MTKFRYCQIMPEFAIPARFRHRFRYHGAYLFFFPVRAFPHFRHVSRKIPVSGILRDVRRGSAAARKRPWPQIRTHARDTQARTGSKKQPQTHANPQKEHHSPKTLNPIARDAFHGRTFNPKAPLRGTRPMAERSTLSKVPLRETRPMAERSTLNPIARAASHGGGFNPKVPLRGTCPMAERSTLNPIARDASDSGIFRQCPQKGTT